MKDGSIVLASKDYRLYIYRYVKVLLDFNLIPQLLPYVLDSSSVHVIMFTTLLESKKILTLFLRASSYPEVQVHFMEVYYPRSILHYVYSEASLMELVNVQVIIPNALHFMPRAYPSQSSGVNFPRLILEFSDIPRLLSWTRLILQFCNILRRISWN